ncbi:hypothetical protein [Janibacter sp. GXQ6167]|uniref:hypothetical protein n=1 Tax=Janibacter sp. GXQ6167 TaxID=3240791 RepID=UPI0035247009
MTTRRFPFFLALIIGLAGMLTACGGGASGTERPAPEPRYELIVTTKDWSGWLPQDAPQPGPQTARLTVRPQASLTVSTVSGPLTLTIAEVREDSVVIESDTPLAAQSTSGSEWSVGDQTRRWEIREGGEIRAITPTLDGGTELRMTLEPLADGGQR